jgi:hypothetical protein
MHKCEKCEKEFDYNYLLLRHKKNKRDCSLPNVIINKKIKECDNKIILINNNINDYDLQINEIDNKINNIDKKIEDIYKKSLKTNTTCYFCNKILSNKPNLIRHIKSNCYKNKDLLIKKGDFNRDKNKIFEDKNNSLELINNLEQEKNKIMDQQKIKEKDDEIKKLRDAMEKMIMKQSTQNINITNNKIINNNLIVNINSFGKEDLSHITLNDYKKFLGGFFTGFIKFIEKVHFDENKPENHNINITNIKSKHLHIYEDDKWTLKDKVDVLDKFINKKYNNLVDKCEELEEQNQLSDKIINDFTQFIHNYKDEEAQRNTKNKITTLIYNNRNKIIIK